MSTAPSGRAGAEVPKLASTDFRFVSAWIQGVGVLDAWERFMAHRGAGDLRRIRSTVRTILDQLAAVATRHGEPAAAALLRRDPASIKATGSSGARRDRSLAAPKLGSKTTPSMPSLAEFAAALPDADFYSEAELVALLEARYGKVASLRPAEGDAPRQRRRDTPELRAVKRKGRLVMRQLEALRRLEALAATSPVPEDRTEAWLDPLTSQRLRVVGVLRLFELMFFIRLHGYRWYKKVPRIGEQGAGRLLRWLSHHERTLGPVAATALQPMTRIGAWVKDPAPRVGVVPIERLRLPATLSGTDGTNRASPERCRARARNDYQAVTEWLELRRPTEGTGNAHTFRAYRKEAERFLLWAVFERQKALSSLDHLDCLEYRRFLGSINPAWIAPSAPRWSEHWRPFAGALGQRSKKAAEAIVTTMCSWLAEVRYLDSNPWTQVPRLNRPLPLQELRSLSDKQWRLVEAWLQGRAETPANDRLRMMFSLALATGMREAELAGARAGWLRQDLDEAGELAWNLVVVGKGSKEREVPLTARVAEQLAGHLAGKGFSRDLGELPPEVPILSGLREVMRPMAPERVYELMKAALVACAAAVELGGDSRSAERIRQASPHWLRHTHGRKFVEAGGDRGVLRQNLGHASDATTAIYDRSAARHRRREVEKVFG